jgi:hypothetical protein
VHIFEINKIKNQKIGNSWSSWAKATDKATGFIPILIQK